VGDGGNLTVWMHVTDVSNDQARVFYSVGFSIGHDITTADCSIGLYAAAANRTATSRPSARRRAAGRTS